MLEHAEQFLMSLARTIAALFVDPREPRFVIAQMIVILLLIPFAFILAGAITRLARFGGRIVSGEDA